MISTLSESWHLEQIISLNDNDSSNGNTTEYLVVVSQEQSNELASNEFVNNNSNNKVKALSGSMSSQTIRNLYR